MASCSPCRKVSTFLKKPVVDSTGIYFTPNLRHLDRGSLQNDNGHYRQYEYVFGATAAAALYRREMIEDIAVDGEFFDCDFFVYREDADVAWRAQLMGWRCLYAPYARGYHVRKVLPGNRRALPAEINMHSVKNRFLLRIKNMTWSLYRKNWLSITCRDLVVVGCCLVREQTSLKAFWFVAQNWKRVVAKRQIIMRRQRVDDDYMASWFNFEPVSKTGFQETQYRFHALPAPLAVNGAHRFTRHPRHPRPLWRFLKLSRKSYRSGSPPVVTMSPFSAENIRRKPCIEACIWFGCPPSATNISIPSRTRSCPLYGS